MQTITNEQNRNKLMMFLLMKNKQTKKDEAQI